MKAETIKALKEEMGYSDVPDATCSICAHCDQRGELGIDVDAHKVCTFNAIGEFTVTSKASCKFFTRKQS